MTAESPVAAPVQSTPKPLRPWKVIVHNDDVNTYEHVIRTFIEVVRMESQDALLKTIQVDKEGLSVVAMAHRERAELLQEQLQSRALTVTIEPD
jgi:ATP-dependent Clp protease adaptor protein ClpS